MTRTTHIPLKEIVDNPFQSRTTFDPVDLQSLADEIAAEGFWGSLQGRRTKNGKVQLVFGHRRLRALRLLNTPSVSVEIVQLTDGQMALRNLEENLQRQGLTDLERADAIKRAVDIVKAEREAAGKPAQGAVREIAQRLGLVEQWVGTLSRISESMDSKDRAPIEAGHLTAKTAFAAKEWGGKAYLQTLAKQGQKATTEGTILKPTHMTVAAMRKVVRQAPDAVQEKLKTLIVAGEIVTPTDADQRARQLASSHMRRQKEPPPDLRIVIVGWTHRIDEWVKDMREVVPYMAYVEKVPAIAESFRTSLRQLIETAQELL
jgi:ParB/RepB/Spo0J family partition protein